MALTACKRDEQGDERVAASNEPARDEQRSSGQHLEPASAGAADDHREEPRRARRGQCQELAAKVDRLISAKLSASAKSSQGGRSSAKTVGELKAKILERMRRMFAAECEKRWAADRVACGMAAKTLEEISRCESKRDLRPKGKRPSKEACAKLGVHVEAVLSKKVSATGARRDKLRAMAAKIAQNTVHACERDMTRSDVACRIKAKTGQEIGACAPGGRSLDRLVHSTLRQLLQPAAAAAEEAAGTAAR